MKLGCRASSELLIHQDDLRKLVAGRVKPELPLPELLLMNTSHCALWSRKWSAETTIPLHNLFSNCSRGAAMLRVFPQVHCPDAGML